MRKSRAARRGGAATSQLLAGAQQVAPPNPRRVGVAYSELDVQEGMAGLAGMLGEERSDSLVAEMAAGVGETVGSDKDGGTTRVLRPLPIDLDVEQVRLLQEIRKASSQLTLDSLSDNSARNSLGGGAFFMTRGSSAGAPDDEEEGDDGQVRRRMISLLMETPELLTSWRDLQNFKDVLELGPETMLLLGAYSLGQCRMAPMKKPKRMRRSILMVQTQQPVRYHLD